MARLTILSFAIRLVVGLGAITAVADDDSSACASAVVVYSEAAPLQPLQPKLSFLGGITRIPNNHLIVVLPGTELELHAERLSTVRADTPAVAARLWFVNAKSGSVVKQLTLPPGSTNLKCIGISPDGRYAAITHLVGRFTRPTYHLSSGWMMGNGLTVVDLPRRDVLGTVLLDDRGKGAANPWGLAWTSDGRRLLVAHAGTHEVSIIDFTALIDRLWDLPAPIPTAEHSGPLSAEQTDLNNYIPFFPAPRKRLTLPSTDRGPRAINMVGSTAYVTNHFSGTITVIDLGSDPPALCSVPGPVRPADTLAARGEFYFHDATICFQGWQSCASCHPDGRADGLNWDLLNDGVANPKNTKSLLLAHATPPAMSIGIRESAAMAVRSGLKHILFSKAGEDVATAINAYLSNLAPEPYPVPLPPERVQSGARVFDSAGCTQCHPAPLFTDLQSHDVGTRGPRDKDIRAFDTPTLVEIWRTAPYLHDGSAATLRDVLTIRNPADLHGRTTGLSASESDDLLAYLLSL